MFARAFAGLNLTPLERAVLKLIEYCVIAGIVAALPVLAQIFAQQQIDWAAAARLAGGTFATAFVAAIWKYLKAHGDAPLPPKQVQIQQTPAGLTVTGAAPQPVAPTAVSAL